MADTAAHQLFLGDFDLIRGGGFDYRMETLAEGASWGNAEPIEVVVRSLFGDGSQVTTEGFDNREVTFDVMISADTSTGLALGEADLYRELVRRNQLKWTPPDGVAPVTVFEVLTSSLTHQFNDEDDLLTQRRFTVRLVCEPFSHSLTEVVAVALEQPANGVTPTVAAIDDGTSAAAWTGNRPIQQVGNYIKVDGAKVMTVRRNGTFDTSVTKYISFEYATPKGELAFLAVSVVPADGGVVQNVKLVARGPGSSARWNRYTVLVTGPSYTAIVFKATYNHFEKKGAEFNVRKVTRSNQSPLVGTARQKFRTLDVAGGVRTQGSLAIEHEASSLGQVLAYTWPDEGSGYLPPMRPWLTSSETPIQDSTLVSGTSTRIDTAITYDVPTARLPEGAYQMVARVRSNIAGVAQTINWTAQLRVGTSGVGTVLSGSRVVSPPAGGGWVYVVLGRPMLPPARVRANSTAVVRVTVAAASAAASDIDVDELWMFNMSIGALLQVDCGNTAPAPGGSSNRLWLDTQTTDDPRPAIYRGFSADRSDAFDAGINTAAWDDQQFVPPTMNVFTVTPNALDAAVSLRHFPHWHTHAAS